MVEIDPDQVAVVIIRVVRPPVDGAVIVSVQIGRIARVGVAVDGAVIVIVVDPDQCRSRRKCRRGPVVEGAVVVPVIVSLYRVKIRLPSSSNV